jgi:hypothetical protein
MLGEPGVEDLTANIANHGVDALRSSKRRKIVATRSTPTGDSDLDHPESEDGMERGAVAEQLADGEPGPEMRKDKLEHDLLDDSITEVPPFICSRCNEEFDLRGSLVQHTWNAHLHGELDPSRTCHVCKPGDGNHHDIEAHGHVGTTKIDDAALETNSGEEDAQVGRTTCLEGNASASANAVDMDGCKSASVSEGEAESDVAVTDAAENLTESDVDSESESGSQGQPDANDDVLEDCEEDCDVGPAIFLELNEKTLIPAMDSATKSRSVLNSDQPGSGKIKQTTLSTDDYAETKSTMSDMEDIPATEPGNVVQDSQSPESGRILGTTAARSMLKKLSRFFG